MAEMSCDTTADRLLGEIYLWIFENPQRTLVLKKQANEAQQTDLEFSFQSLTVSDASNVSTFTEDENDEHENYETKLEKIKEKVNQLNETLRSESQHKKEKDVDRYVLFELLKSLGKSEGLTDPRSTRAIEQLMDDHLKSQTPSVFRDAMTYLLHVLQFFSINILVANKLTVRQDTAMAAGNGAQATEGLELNEVIYEAQNRLAEAVQSQTGQSGRQQDQKQGSKSSRSELEDAIGGSRKKTKKVMGAGADPSKSNKEEKKEKKEKNVRMALLNVHSVGKKSISEGSLIKNLILHHKLDFFLITETWLKPGQKGDEVLRSVLPPNQNFIHQPRESGRGGGVAIVYSDQFQCRRVALPRKSTFEYVAGSVQHETWDRPVLIISLYHPTAKNKDEFSKFLTEFTCLWKMMSKKYSSIVVAGDFNIWIENENKRPSKEFGQFLQDNELDQFVHESTHRRGHTLDLVIGREMDITIVGVQDDNISDHYTVRFNAKPKKQ